MHPLQNLSCANVFYANAFINSVSSTNASIITASKTNLSCAIASVQILLCGSIYLQMHLIIWFFCECKYFNCFHNKYVSASVSSQNMFCANADFANASIHLFLRLIQVYFLFLSHTYLVQPVLYKTCAIVCLQMHPSIGFIC